MLRYRKILQAKVLQANNDIDFCVVIVASTFFCLDAVRHIDEKERLVREHELLIGVGFIATLDAIVVEQEIRYIHERAVHSILNIEEAVRMSSLNKASVERRWPFNFEGVGWPKLLLVTDKDYLLCVNTAKESLILFHHGRLIHDDSFKLASSKTFGAGFTYSGDNNWCLCQHLLLILPFLLKKLHKLLSSELLYGLHREAEKVHVIAVKALFLLPYEVSKLFFIC